MMAAAGKIAFGGPLFEDFASQKLTGALLIVDAGSLEEARQIAEGDPWFRAGKFRIEAVHAWMVSVSSETSR